MKACSLKEFQDCTALLPALIAGIISHGDAEFAGWAEGRTLFLYNHNARWRRMLDGANGREWLYAFIEHWWEAWQKGKA